MKKVKLMLLSLTVLAVVGGALAFKTKGPIRFCTADPVNGSCPATCPNDKTGALDDTKSFVCTTTTSGLSTPCQNSGGTTLACNVSAKIALD